VHIRHRMATCSASTTVRQSSYCRPAIVRQRLDSCSSHLPERETPHAKVRAKAQVRPINATITGRQQQQQPGYWPSAYGNRTALNQQGRKWPTTRGNTFPPGGLMRHAPQGNLTPPTNKCEQKKCHSSRPLPLDNSVSRLPPSLKTLQPLRVYPSGLRTWPPSLSDDAAAGRLGFPSTGLWEGPRAPTSRIPVGIVLLAPSLYSASLKFPADRYGPPKPPPPSPSPPPPRIAVLVLTPPPPTWPLACCLLSCQRPRPAGPGMEGRVVRFVVAAVAGE
jgi:hypothetical protein